LIARAVLSEVPLLLAMKAHPEIHLFPIIVTLMISHIIYLIPLSTFANITATAASPTFVLKEQSFYSEPIRSLGCNGPFRQGW
jgi:hypothetical protein